MASLKKMIAPVLAGAALGLSGASAFAMTVGQSGTLADIQGNLAKEGQVEIATGATGQMPNLRGVKFYFNETSKIGYIALTNDPIRPTQMRIIFQTAKTTPVAAVDFGDPAMGSIRCNKLAAQGAVAPGNCSSFKDTLDVSKTAGMEIIQQGIMPTLNILTSFINTATGTGIVYESTQDGATVSKLVVGNAKYTEAGARIVAGTTARKTAGTEIKTEPKI